MTDHTEAAVLLRAVDVITQRGWCQGENEDDQGRVCALGAILSAAGNDSDLADDVQTRLSDHLGHWVARWNDTPGRTQEQVVAALRAAAEAVPA